MDVYVKKPRFNPNTGEPEGHRLARVRTTRRLIEEGEISPEQLIGGQE